MAKMEWRKVDLDGDFIQRLKQKKVDLKENVHGRNFEQKCELVEISGFDLGICFELDLGMGIRYLRSLCVW